MDKAIKNIVNDLIRTIETEFSEDEIENLIYVAQVNANNLFEKNILDGIEIVMRHTIMAISNQKRVNRLRQAQSEFLNRKRPTPTEQIRRDIDILKNAKNLFSRYGIKKRALQSIETIDDFINDLERFLDGKPPYQINVQSYEFRTKIELGKLHKAIYDELQDNEIQLRNKRVLGTMFKQLLIE